MKLQEIYQLAIKMGKEADPRGPEGVEKDLQRAQKAFDKMDGEEKEFFDQDTLFNPYADTRILTGDPQAEIKKLLCGIDIESGEIALAETLNQRGAGIDLLLAHHPEGAALAALAQVMGLQSGYMARYGVLPNVAESLMDERIKDVDRSVSVTNHFRSVQAAELLGFNFACVHTPCDNLVTQFLTNYLAEEQPDTLDDLVKALRKLPEYRHASLNHNPPRIVSGSGKYSVGKIYVDFTGGTGGHKDNMRALCQSGVSTVICMHMGEETLKVAKEVRLNVVLAGHIASDNIGLNLFLDQLEAHGLEIVAGSGLVRVSRLAKA